MWTENFMTIKSLKLTNFRNWVDYQLDFNNVTILIGKNGVGKTNLMEAVWLLSTGRSWRTSRDGEMISWDQDFSRLTLSGLKQEKETTLELFWQKPARHASLQGVAGGGEKNIKQLKLNGVKHRLIDLLGVAPTVLFSPETIELLGGAPVLRRRFLDIMLAQIDRTYALHLAEYTKVLRERNKLLAALNFRKGQPDELDFWDDKLTENGLAIIEARKLAIKFFNLHLAEAYETLSGGKEKMSLKYKESADFERFKEVLFAHRERDISQTNTIIGPHRDDLVVLLNGKDITTFGSRGEFRSAVLALKMAELAYLQEKTQESPVLLLDDIFSELDASRRAHLAKIVSHQQTIITTTDLDHIEKSLREKAKIVELK